MKTKILIIGLILLAVLSVTAVSASEDALQNDSSVSDEVLSQDVTSEVCQSDIGSDGEILQSSDDYDDKELMQVSASQEELAMVVINNPDNGSSNASVYSNGQDLLGASQKNNVPAYLAKSNIWFQETELNVVDSNMWILNDNAKAFPKNSYIKIVAKEKGSKYKAQDIKPISDIFSERGMDNIHYYILLREFTNIQFKTYKSYNIKVYHVSAAGKAHLIGKKNIKIKWTKNEYGFSKIGNYYMLYKYKMNNPYGNFKLKVFKTHPNDKEKIQVIIYKKNGKIVANKKFKYDINGKVISAKTNSRGLLVIPTPKKTGTYTILVMTSNGHLVFKVKVSHSVSIPKVTIKKSAKKVTIPLQLKKINGKFYKNQKITFKLDNKTYKVKTNKKGIAKVTIKKSTLKNLQIGQKVLLQATYKNDTAKKVVKVK